MPTVPSRLVRQDRPLTRPTPRPPGGFTLVELLVVIGIIALLVAILLPALNRARAQANLVACAANQRSILQSLILHASDHKGYMPIVGRAYPKATPDGLSDSSQTHYDYFNDPADGNKPRPMPLTAAVATTLKQRFRSDSWDNMVNDCNTGLVGKMFLCPADKDNGHPASLIEDSSGWIKAGPFPITGYAFNEAALGFAEPTTAGGPPGSPPLNHSRQRGHASRFPHPTELLLMSDAKPRNEGTNFPYQLYYDVDPNCTLADVYNCPFDGFVVGPGQPGPAGDASGKAAGSGSLLDKSRHPGKRMNVGFADGHVENVPIEPGALSKISLDRDFH